MKSEHRHDLQTNDLSKLADKASATFDAHYNQIMFGVCAILLLTAGWVYWSRSSNAAAGAAWADLASAQSPDELADVADKHSGTSAAHWAKLQEADSYLATGVRELFTNREKAVSDLKEGQEAYKELLATRGVSPDIRERAQFGLARTLESLAGKDVDPAIQAYETLIKEFPESIYVEEANRRVAALKTSGTQSFYAWFQTQNPKPPEPGKPTDTGPAESGIDAPRTAPASTLPDISSLLGNPADAAADSELMFDVEKALRDAGDAGSTETPDTPASPPEDGAAAPLEPKPAAPADSATPQ